MSDLTETLRNTVLLIPMKNGGEVVTELGVFAADRIDELEEQVVNLSNTIAYIDARNDEHRKHIDALECENDTLRDMLDAQDIDADEVIE